MRRQKTFYVDEEKIKIVTQSRTYVGNPNGFWVTINEERFYSNNLNIDTAEKSCYMKWVKKHNSCGEIK